VTTAWPGIDHIEVTFDTPTWNPPLLLVATLVVRPCLEHLINDLVDLTVSKDTFAYLHQFAWLRVVRWLRRKHHRAKWGWLRRHYLVNTCVARAQRRRTVRMSSSARDPLSLPRRGDPFAVGGDQGGCGSAPSGPRFCHANPL